MAAKSRNCQEDKQKEEKERRLAIKLLYLDKEYTVRFSSKADTKTICQAVKKKTGVKGTFYLHGEGIRGYLHSSSLTAANLKKFGGKPVELRGGGWISKGGDALWYYYSQKLRPDLQEKKAGTQQPLLVKKSC